jgi:hypothetical protein
MDYLPLSKTGVIQEKTDHEGSEEDQALKAIVSAVNRSV